MVDHLPVCGHVVVDAGAVEKLTVGGGKSLLLPIGIGAVQGVFARGLTNYSSAKTKLIKRRPSGEIETVLGYMLEPELIHRDNLVLV